MEKDNPHKEDNLLPNEVIIELTNGCNLECSFCMNNRRLKNLTELHFTKVFSVLEDIKEHGIKAVRFTGGEPFLRRDLPDILRKAKSLGLYVILNTNSILL